MERVLCDYGYGHDYHHHANAHVRAHDQYDCCVNAHDCLATNDHYVHDHAN